MLRRLSCLAIVLAAPSLGAQSILDIGARVAPQYHSYNIEAPSNIKVSEFASPLFVLIPITSSFSFDIGTAFAQSHVEQTSAAKTVTSNISGLTDTQIRGNLTLGNDQVVITGGVNLPTGKSKVATDQVLAAGLISSDFLVFPIMTMGAGFGGTGGIAFAQPVGDWSVGFGLSARMTSQYDPFAASVTGSSTLHYQPGNEYRARLGLDHAVGTGRLTLGVTYSKFGNDNFGGSIYNTGDRVISQLDYSNSLGIGRIAIDGWDLFRLTGQLADTSTVGHQNIANGAVAYGIPIGSAVLEPNVEGRAWVQEGASTSVLGTVGLRLQFSLGGISVLPSAGYSFGQLAAQDPTGLNTTATMTGFHGTLAIRLR